MHSATSSGQSASSVIGSNSSFVDPSVLQDQQRGLSQWVIDTKWGTGTSSALEQQNKTYGTGNYSTSSSYYNPATWYYESVPSGSTSGNRWLTTYTANSGAKVVNSPYTNQGAGSYRYNPTSWFYEKVVGNNTEKGLTYQEDTDYYGTLYDKDKFSPETTYQRGWDNTNPLTNTNLTNQDNTNVDLTGNVNQNMNKWGSFTQAVNNKLQTAFWMQDLNELKSKYPEQYSSLIQALDSVAWTWNSLDPSQRGMLEWQLQAIIWTAVGAWSDTSKLNVLNESIMNKFENGQQVANDMKNIIKLQTEWLTTKEIAKKMWVSEDQVQQAILAYNWLDNRLWEYYKLKSKEAAEITEPYDTKIERLQKEKEIQLERANRQVEWMKEDFDKNLERQKQANEINLHNADFMAGQYWFWFSKRGIEWMNYVTDQAKQIIDDMVTNYDRNNQEMADWVADILRNWERNNEDLLKASEDALNTAKNNYTSNMLAIQQQYWTVWMQAQQQLANNVQNFITQAETIYDNALNRQQQNLTNLITNFSNLNALQYSNLTLRNAQIQQFQSESMNMNRNQLQGLAQQLGMDSASMQDLVNYQAQAVANELNGYIPWAWMQFQNQIQSYLNQWYTPNQALSMIMNSQDFKAMQSTGAGENRAMSGGIMYNKATGQYVDLNWDEYWTIWENLYNKRTGEIISSKAWDSSNYVTSQTVNGQTYGVSQNTYNWLVSFYNKFADANWNIKKWAKWWQCGSFVNDYLQSLWLSRVFTDPIDKKVAAINTPEWYKPQVWDVVVMDSPNAKTKQYGHVAIVIWVDGNKITTLESNKKWEGDVFSRTIDTSKNKVHGYYHPDGVGSSQSSSWPSTDYGVPISYDRSIKAMIPTQLMNSDKELDKLESNIAALYKAWYSAEDAVLQYMWFNIDKEENKEIALNLVNAVRSLSNEDSVQSAVSYISQRVNAGDYKWAITKVENLVRAEAKRQEWSWYFDESTARSLVTKANDLLTLARSMENNIWLFQWTMQKYLKKLKSSDAAKLNTAIFYLTNEQQLKSTMSGWELDTVMNWVPQIDDRTDTFMNKVEQMKKNALESINSWRQTYWLPPLTEEALLNNDNRVSLYQWGSTSSPRWLKGTVNLQWYGRS